MNFLDKSISLTPLARQIIFDKATELPHSGNYNKPMEQGSYLCRRCGIALFRANSQFSSSCGWPSFDAEIKHAIRQTTDADGRRTEILCARCDAHLGHIFVGEYLTDQNKRYCVNSASLDFVATSTIKDTEEVIFAGGCFWGIDYYLSQWPGVIKVEVGYCGGKVEQPTYEQVCNGTTGHYEAARVVYDREKINFESILKHFFEIHDPTQSNGQGPDIGQQYQSAVFYYNDEQKKITEKLIQLLKHNGFHVATKLLPMATFWPAENYHQNYYQKQGKMPYCHRKITRF